MRFFKYILFSLALIFIHLNVGANSISLADSLYKNKDYSEAASIYEEIMQKQGVSAELLYNLGNTYYSMGENGKAMLCYERAKKLLPGNKIINHNLELLRIKVTESNKGSLQGKEGNVEPERETFMDNIYKIIAVDSSSDSWAVFAVLSFILFLLALSMYVFTPNVLARKTGFFSGITFLSFTIIFIVFACLGSSHFNKKDEAVLMDFSVRLLEQPKEGSLQSSSLLNKGTKLHIMEIKTDNTGEEWLKVRLNSDNIGWIKSQSVEII